MKNAFVLIAFCTIFISCKQQPETANSTTGPKEIEGTWKLISGTLIEKGDTTITYYDKNLSFIKIINNSHFAFLKHDLKQGKDPATAAYDSGGGSYTLKDSTYTENLEYCTAREWEGHTFKFTLNFNKDTLIQSGIEVVESEGINRMNIEKYVRLKK